MMSSARGIRSRVSPRRRRFGALATIATGPVFLLARLRRGADARTTCRRIDRMAQSASGLCGPTTELADDLSGPLREDRDRTANCEVARASGASEIRAGVARAR